MFSTHPKRISIVKLNLFCHLQLLSIWTNLKICRLVRNYVNNTTKCRDLTTLTLKTFENIEVKGENVSLINPNKDKFNHVCNSNIVVFFLFQFGRVNILIRLNRINPLPHETRCVCQTLMPPKHPSFEKYDPDI